jgi:hypothetical protein
MLKVKYLWALALVALCVSLASGMAFAQDSWVITTVMVDDDDDPDTPDVAQDLVDLPDGLAWEEDYAGVVGADNVSAVEWDKATYALLSVEGVTATGLTAIDRWGMTQVALSANVLAGGSVEFALPLVAPPVNGLFDCNWIMGNSGLAIETDMAAASVRVSRFGDLLPPYAWAAAVEKIEACAGLVPEIVKGYSATVYNPTQKVNRAQMAVYIRRGMQIDEVLPAEGGETFTDVAFDHWAVGSIEALAAEDATPEGAVVLGYGDTYQPTWIVNRAQMAVFIRKALSLDITPFDPEADPAPVPTYTDVPIDYWAWPSVEACAAANIVKGYADGTYKPTVEITRDQLAVYCSRAFIEGADAPVVVGGPAVTDVDLLTVPAYHGWTSTLVDPDWAYVEFDAAAVGPDLAGAGTWDILFEFAPIATPTTIEESAMVSLDAADLTGLTGDYLTVAADIPGMTPGQKIMYTTVESADGTPIQLSRTVTFELLEPPPPPGTPRPPNALGSADWNSLAPGTDDNDTDPIGDDTPVVETRPGAVYLSGSFSNMKFSDDSYYVLATPTLPVTSWNEGGGCCESNGVTLKWTGLEIPLAATEMKVTLEYHVGVNDLDQNAMACCSNNMCEEWGSPYVDGVNVNYGWGLVMVNQWINPLPFDPSDPSGLSTPGAWDWDGSVSGSPSAEIQNTAAEGGYNDPLDVPDAGWVFAYNPTADMVMTWTANDWTNFVKDGVAMLHICSGGSIPFFYIDQCMLEFSPLDP